MSLFIGGLAFGDASRQNDAAKLGVLLGSIVAAVTGYVHLRVAKPHDRSLFEAQERSEQTRRKRPSAARRFNGAVLTDQ